MKDTKIYIAGHTGLIGKTVFNRFTHEGYTNIIVRTHGELDLTHQSEVEKFFQKEKPEFVILAAAKVGGIHANITYPAEFLYDNLYIQTNVIHSSFKAKVKKLLFFGSACSYPRDCPQPMKEEYLLSGYLEPTNEAYAIAKIAGIKMCQAYAKEYGVNFICALPTNTYGPGDNFSHKDSHVIPALLRRFHKAKITSKETVNIWGTGKILREFIYVEDVADACLFLMQNYNNPEVINVGLGKDVSIKELAYLVKKVTGFSGEITFDTSKPDGMPRKLLDVSKINKLGWQAKISLEEGLKKTYKWYISNIENKDN